MPARTPKTLIALFLTLIVLFACDAAPRRPREERSSSEPVLEKKGLAEAAERVAYERYRVDERLSLDLTRPAKFREQACPDPELSQLGLDENALTLVLAVTDARLEPRQLLPVDLKERLLGQGKKPGSRASHEIIEQAPLPASEPEVRRVLSDLSALSKRRYKAVYYITEYASPHLIRKLNRRRSEWIPGVIVAWLSVHDLADGRLLCQTQIVVRNDVKDEPISIRMKSAVRERLIGELGSELAQSSIPALGRMSKLLRLPLIDER